MDITKTDLLSQLKKKLGSVSSSDIQGCSCRVHDNPLFADCVVNGRLHSDLEFALQDSTGKYQELATSVVREPSSDEDWSHVHGTRHMSLAYIMSQLDDDTEQNIKDTAQELVDRYNEENAPAVEAPSAEPSKAD